VQIIWEDGHLGGAYVFLDPADDGAAEGVKVAVVLKPPDNFCRRKRPPHAEIAHGSGDGRRGPKPQALALLYWLTSSSVTCCSEYDPFSLNKKENTTLSYITKLIGNSHLEQGKVRFTVLNNSLCLFDYNISILTHILSNPNFSLK
jgi:hypothetical protein